MKARPGQRDDSQLTVRELQVLREASTGKTNAEISKSLFIGVETVKFHLQAVYRKLGTRNRVSAIFQAVRKDLIPCPFCPKRTV